MTKCGKCGGGFFRVQNIEPSGSAFKMTAIQCSACGIAFGVTDYYNTGTLLKNQEKLLKDQEKRLKTMEAYLADLDTKVTKIVRSLR